MAFEIETYTNAAGVRCMRLRQVGADDPPAPSNLARIRPGEVLASIMVPVEAGRGTTRSSIIRAPVAPVQQPTADDLKIAAMLGVSPEAFAAQRALERKHGRWTSGPVNEGDE